jgi:hypothetical protein
MGLWSREVPLFIIVRADRSINNTAPGFALPMEPTVLLIDLSTGPVYDYNKQGNTK